MLNTGWTWEYVDEQLTLPRVLALTGYWRRVPPLAEMFAGFAGYTPPPDADAAEPVKGFEDFLREVVGVTG